MMRLFKLVLFALSLTVTLPATAQNKAIVDSLLRLLPHSADTVKVGMLIRLRGEYQNDIDRAMQYGEQALVLAQKIHWPRGVAWAQLGLGSVYRAKGNLPRAQGLLLQAMGYLKRQPNTRRYFFCTLNLGDIAFQMGDTTNAEHWYQLALRSAKAQRDTANLVRVYTAFGSKANSQQRPQLALAWYKRALDLAQTGSVPGLLNYTLNDLASTYISMGQPRRALPYLFRALSYMEQTNDKTGQLVVTGSIAQAYQALNQPTVALPYALRARQLAVAVQSRTYEQQCDTLLAHIEAKRGNYRAAYKYAELGATAERAMLNETKARALVEQQTRYETQEKERSIQFLTQRNALQTLATERQTALRNVAAAASALLLLLLGVVYNRYQLRQRTVRQLDAQNREKALLLREIHHRVKNNLQIVLSLLTSQLHRLRDPAAAEAIRESQSRVRAMALIHQTLYQSETLARVDMARYLTQLVDALRRSFRQEARGVAVQVGVAALELSTHTAVPLGLVVNELLTNAFKYAFPDLATRSEPPTLRVELRAAGAADAYELVVADNGVGLPADVELTTFPTLGLRLVSGFVAQIHGTVTVERTAGTRFVVVFKEMEVTADPEPVEIPHVEASAAT